MADFQIYGQLKQFGDEVGFSIGGSLPQFEGSIVVENMNFVVAGTLEQFSGEIVTSAGYPCEIKGELPQFSGSIAMTPGTTVAIAGTFDQFTGSISVSHGKTFEIAGTLEQFTGSITTLANSNFAVSGTLPQFGGDIYFAGTFQVVAVNAFNRAITEYTNYGFESLIDHGGRYYGIKSDGIYLLEGADDDGTDIAASLQTGQMSFGTARGKGISNIYVQGEVDGSMTTTMISDKNTQRFTRTLTGTSETTPSHMRARYPYSYLSRLWGLRIGNVSGAPVSIDTVEIETGTTQSY